MINTEKLDYAFKLMRQRNLVAKQNFACCGQCALRQINDIALERMNRAKQVVGIVFYHRQDAEKRAQEKGFHLSYGYVNFDSNGSVTNDQVGIIVTACLRQAGVEFDWSGNADEKIFIKPGF